MTLLIWGTHTLWLSMDSRPPVWDMAIHQSYAFNYLAFVHGESATMPFWAMSGYYPPFVHLLIALVWFVSRPDPQLATLANLPATVVLLWAVYELGAQLAGRTAGRWAALITAFTPYLIWMSRETILDYWLSAWVAASLVVLRRADGFLHRRRSFQLGIVMALGLLTKWLFAAFVIFPLLYVVIRQRVWQDATRLRNLVASLLIAAALAGIWYVPNLAGMLRFFRQKDAAGALEGEPPPLSFESFVYYLRLLEGYQLFALLFSFLMVSCAFVWRKRLIRDAGFLAVTISGAWLVLTVLRTKDPRYTMPLLGLLAILPGAWIQSWGNAWAAGACKMLLTATLILQTYVINFGASWLPEAVVLAEGYTGSLRWDWNLYLQHYFHILGPPRLEDWRHGEILHKIARHAQYNGVSPSLGVAPDLPRFNANNFALSARLLGSAAPVSRLVLTPAGLYPLEHLNYVIIADGDQGPAWTTTTNEAVNRIIRESPMFQFLTAYPLPNGSMARLYSVGHNK